MRTQRFILQTRGLLKRRGSECFKHILCPLFTSLGTSISSSTLIHRHTFSLSPSTSSSKDQILLSRFSANSSRSSICSRAALILSINFRIFKSCFLIFFSRATSSAFHQVALLPSDVRSLSTLFRTFMHSWPSVCTLASDLSHYKGCPISLNWLPGYLDLYLVLKFQDPQN